MKLVLAPCITDDEKWLMSFIYAAKQLGISADVTLWVTPSYDLGCTPFVKISNLLGKPQVGSAWVLSVEDEPVILAGSPLWVSDADIAKIKAWVVLNKQTLLKHWHGEYSTGDALMKLEMTKR